jgi:LCP family protein required for cell wall assembly
MRKYKKQIILMAMLFVVIFLGIKVAKYSSFLYQLFFHKEIALKKADGHINFLLMGRGGGTHDGPDLTDTIMFASIDQDNNKVTMVSIPRDLWVPALDGKINTAYAKGKSKQEGGGLVLAKAVVSRIVNQPIDYSFVIDFDGFVKAVDLIGGLDIDVDNTFDDLQYPVEEKYTDLCGHTPEEATQLIATQEATVVFPCRYEHLHFDKGPTHMEGKLALKYVRSRYAQGPEGTDFARSRRQEKVIQAFKQKILSAGTIFNPAKILGLYNILKDSIDTDISQDELDDFVRLAQKMKSADIKSYVVDYGDTQTNRPGLLVNPPISMQNYGGAWVLVPRRGSDNYTEIQNYVSCVLVKSTCPISAK